MSKSIQSFDLQAMIPWKQMGKPYHLRGHWEMNMAGLEAIQNEVEESGIQVHVGQGILGFGYRAIIDDKEPWVTFVVDREVK